MTLCIGIRVKSPCVHTRILQIPYVFTAKQYFFLLFFQYNVRRFSTRVIYTHTHTHGAYIHVTHCTNIIYQRVLSYYNIIYLPQNGSSSLVNRYILPRAGDLSEWYPMLPHLDLSLHGKHSPSRNFSYDSHGTAGNAHPGDTLSVKNLYALRWLHRLLPYTSGAAETTCERETIKRRALRCGHVKISHCRHLRTQGGWGVGRHGIWGSDSARSYQFSCWEIIAYRIYA